MPWPSQVVIRAWVYTWQVRKKVEVVLCSLFPHCMQRFWILVCLNMQHFKAVNSMGPKCARWVSKRKREGVCVRETEKEREWKIKREMEKKGGKQGGRKDDRVTAVFIQRWLDINWLSCSLPVNARQQCYKERGKTREEVTKNRTGVPWLWHSRRN